METTLESQIIKLIKSKRQALEENLLLSEEVEEIRTELEDFLDEKLTDTNLLALHYREFKLSRKNKTLWSNSAGFPSDGGFNYLKPYIDFF